MFFLTYTNSATFGYAKGITKQKLEKYHCKQPKYSSLALYLGWDLVNNNNNNNNTNKNIFNNNNNNNFIKLIKYFPRTLQDNYVQHKTIYNNNSNKVVKKGSKM